MTRTYRIVPMKVFVVEMLAGDEWEYVGLGNEESTARALISEREKSDDQDFLVQPEE